MPSKEAIVEKIRALMARASDPGASEEEQRTSAHVAAKLCREHGIELGDIGAPSVVHERAEFTLNGVRTVIETIRSAGPQVNAALGFDVFGFAQGLVRDRAKEALESALGRKKPRARARKKR